MSAELIVILLIVCMIYGICDGLRKLKRKNNFIIKEKINFWIF